MGYVGWSTLGGYGPFSTCYGLGVDQIVAAKVVNAEGQIVDADNDMLTGIRGGGGTLGVITELTIKVYPLEKVSGFDTQCRKDRVRLGANLVSLPRFSSQRLCMIRPTWNQLCLPT